MTDLFGHTKILALSWKQPFGSAMLVGKDETRVWSTKYRGPVLICASAIGYSIAATKEITGELQFTRLMNAVDPISSTLNLFGMAIGIGRIVDCREMRPEDEDKTFVQYRAPWIEHRMGKDGRIRAVQLRRYCHIYKDVRSIKPFPWKGSQGWTTVPPEYLFLINEQYPDYFKH